MELQRPAPHVADRLMACVVPFYWGEPCDEARRGRAAAEARRCSRLDLVKIGRACAGLGPRFINSRPPRFVAYHLIPRLRSVCVCVSCIAHSLTPSCFLLVSFPLPTCISSINCHSATHAHLTRNLLLNAECAHRRTPYPTPSHHAYCQVETHTTIRTATL